MLEALTAASDTFAPDLSVAVLTRDPEAFRARAPLLARHPAVRLVTGDVRDFSFPAEGFSFVIHAAFDSSREPSPEQTRSTIIEGTARCLELARRAGTRRFLLVSSGAAYGRQPADVERSSEEAIGGSWPRTVYGAAKREAERLAFEAAGHGGPAATVARGFALVGELNTAFGFSVFALGILIGIPYSLAALVSTVLGALSNFQRYGTLVFGSHDNRLILRFFAAYGLCYAVGLAPLSGARAHSLPILSVAAVCALPMAPLEFALQRLFVFRAARSPLELSLRR